MGARPPARSLRTERWFAPVNIKSSISYLESCRIRATYSHPQNPGQNASVWIPHAPVAGFGDATCRMQQGDSFLSAFWLLNMLLPISRSEDRLVGWFDRSKNEGWSEGNDQHAHLCNYWIRNLTSGRVAVIICAVFRPGKPLFRRVSSVARVDRHFPTGKNINSWKVKWST